MVYRFLTVMLAAAAGFFVPAVAQDVENDDADSFRRIIEREADELSVRNPQDSDIINLVERIMMVRLAQTLELSVEETQNLGTRVGECRSRVYNLKWLRAELRHSLREALKSGDEAVIERQLDKLLTLEITIAELIEQMIEDSKQELSVEQAAKFYLFIEDFERDLSRMVDKAQLLTEQKHDHEAPSSDVSGSESSTQ